MDSEKSIHSFEIKNDMLHDYLMKQFFYLLVNNFSTLLLLCKINIVDITLSDFLRFLFYREVLKF